jgi:hypothetical protein
MSDGAVTRNPKRKRLLIAAVAGVAIVLVAGVIWLFSSEGEAPKAPVNVADLPRVDGTLNVVEPDRLVMTPFTPLDGKTSIEFTVPEKYRGSFDLAHLRSHSSVGLPTRIFYLKEGEQYIAVYKADAPANNAGG